MNQKKLMEIIRSANKAYYQDSNEIMSNREYDALYDELMKLEQDTGIIYAGSPTQTVGYEVISEFPKERHVKPMLSLDKTKDVSRLVEWLGNKEGILSWKLDGLTVVLHYIDGLLQKALTRGNGEIGEVITSNAKLFDNIPVVIPYKGELTVRGEAVISYEDFERINDNLPEESKYKNPRNLASGSVRQLNNRITANRHVSFIAFELVSEIDGVDTVDKRFEWLESQGITVVARQLVTQDALKQTVSEFADAVEDNRFPSDGLVLTYNDYQYGVSLGMTSKHPLSGIAFKWKDDVVEATLLDVQWNTSRTGVINPVAIFSPVEIEGTTVERATLNNISFIEDLALGIGDQIEVYKANKIIPTVADNLTRSNTLTIPSQCPSCGAKTEIRSPHESKSLWCTNSECEAKLISKFTHFVSRNAMNIKGLSEATLSFLIKKKWIVNFVDLFDLEKYKEEWSNTSGFGVSSVKNALKSIEKSKVVVLRNFIYSLGIPMIGNTQSKELAKLFLKWEDFVEAVRRGHDFSLIDGFGDVRNENIHNWFRNDFEKGKIAVLAEAMKFEEAASPRTDSTQRKKTIMDKVFCITGSVSHFANRKAVQEAIEKAGGKVTGSVSKNTDFLVNNDKESKSSKNKKATELGVRIISENELISMLDGFS